MIDIRLLSEDVLSSVRKNLGIDSDDSSMDNIISKMSEKEVFERYLTWNGMPGWSDKIWDAVDDIKKSKKFYLRGN